MRETVSEETLRDGATARNGVCLVVLGLWKGVCATDKWSVPYYEACVMDGSRAVFRLRVSSGMHDHVSADFDSYQPGCLIRVRDHRILWMTGGDSIRRRMVMVVDSMRIETRAPIVLSTEVDCPVVCDRINKRAIASVLEESLLVFLVQGGDGVWVMGRSPPWLLPRGVKRKRHTNLCDCHSKCEMSECLLSLCPLTSERERERPGWAS